MRSAKTSHVSGSVRLQAGWQRAWIFSSVSLNSNVTAMQLTVNDGLVCQSGTDIMSNIAHVCHERHAVTIWLTIITLVSREMLRVSLARKSRNVSPKCDRDMRKDFIQVWHGHQEGFYLAVSTITVSTSYLLTSNAHITRII